MIYDCRLDRTIDGNGDESSRHETQTTTDEGGICPCLSRKNSGNNGGRGDKTDKVAVWGRNNRGSGSFSYTWRISGSMQKRMGLDETMVRVEGLPL